MLRSADGAAGVVFLAVLLTRSGSLVPSGGVTVAVLTRLPVVEEGTVPVTVNRALLLAGKLTSASISPLPVAVPQLACAVAVQVQVNADSPAGSASCTRALVTSL